MTTNFKSKSAIVELKALLEDDEGRLRTLFQEFLQELLEQEMTRTLAAAPSERIPDRSGYRAGHHPCSLVTRVGKLELRVPRDREGRFSTELSEHYQRSEQALVEALAQMYIQGCRRARSRRSPRSCAATASPPPPSPGSTSAWTRP